MDESEDALNALGGLLPASGRLDGLYALKVEGDSMVDAGVHDGDMVVLKRTDVASNGELVSIWLPRRDRTVLRYYVKTAAGIQLKPPVPGPDALELEPDEPFMIQGRVIMVLRALPNSSG